MVVVTHQHLCAKGYEVACLRFWSSTVAYQKCFSGTILLSFEPSCILCDRMAVDWWIQCSLFCPQLLTSRQLSVSATVHAACRQHWLSCVRQLAWYMTSLQHMHPSSQPSTPHWPRYMHYRMTSPRYGSRWMLRSLYHFLETRLKNVQQSLVLLPNFSVHRWHDCLLLLLRFSVTFVCLSFI